MKSTLIIASAILLCLAMCLPCPKTHAQERGFQWGIAVKGDAFLYQSQVAGNVLLGYRFDRNNYFGGQVGISYGDVVNDAEPDVYNYVGIPFLIDYIHYCPIGMSKRNSFIYGAEAGLILGHRLKDEQSDYYVNTGTMVASLKAGMDFDLGRDTHIFFDFRANFIGAGVGAGITF